MVSANRLNAGDYAFCACVSLHWMSVCEFVYLCVHVFICMGTFFIIFYSDKWARLDFL